MWFNPAELAKAPCHLPATFATLRLSEGNPPFSALKVAKSQESQTSQVQSLAKETQRVGAGDTATHAEILERDSDAVAAEPFSATIRKPSALLTAEEETAIRAWLALIEETDPSSIAEVIYQCQQDADARDCFTGRAAADNLQKKRAAAAFDDDRRTCEQCANLIARRCQAANRGAFVASSNYEPVRVILRRCEGYAPRSDDTDRRLGRERWPQLT